MQESESLAVEWWPVDRVIPYPGNPRIITDAAVGMVAASIEEFGWRQPIVVDEEGIILVGHTRRLAAIRLGRGRVPVHIAHGLTEAQKRAYRLADNRTGEEAGWALPALDLELSALDQLGFDLSLTGFSLQELGDLPFRAHPSGDDHLDESGDPPVQGRGQLLDLINVTVADPRHQVVKGDHYRIGGRHHVLCVGVMTDWPRWAPLLNDGAIFVPYPGPFVPYGKRAEEHMLVLVQPDPYAAGHLLDRYAEIHGEAAVERV
jgi:ParB-like nuclease domain